MWEPTPPLRDVLARQDGLATIDQLLAHEVSRAEYRGRRGRAWREVLPRVILVQPGELTVRRQMIGALLWAGSDAVLSGPTAARWHGVQAADPRGRVHVVLPAGGDSRSVGFASARRSLLHDEDVRSVGSLRFSSPARSCVDAAFAAGTPATRAAILTEAVHRKVATLEELTDWLCRLRTRDAYRLKPALEAAAAGAWSAPEAELLDLIAGSGVLPEPWANPSLTTDGHALLTPDIWFDEVAMAVMVHSYAYHSQGDDWSSTVERDADLVAAGVMVLGVTPDRIRTDPVGVVQRIEKAHVTASGRPRPDVCATRRCG